MEKEKDQDLFRALRGIYRCYGEFVQDFPAACGPGCSACCTTNVLATSLEVKYLMFQAREAQVEIPWSRVRKASCGPVYRPHLTTNQVADFCLRQQELPADPGEHGPGHCPLLSEDNLCILYEHRPFACRAMISASMCSPDGEAKMDQFLVSVNLCLYQILEHLDSGGLYGNILDLLLKFHGEKVEGFLENRPLPGFLVRPWERKQFEKFLARLYRFDAEGTELGSLLNLE